MLSPSHAPASTTAFQIGNGGSERLGTSRSQKCEGKNCPSKAVGSNVHLSTLLSPLGPSCFLQTEVLQHRGIPVELL